MTRPEKLWTVMIAGQKWVIKGRKQQYRFKRHQGGGRIIVWGAMGGETLEFQKM